MAFSGVARDCRVLVAAGLLFSSAACSYSYVDSNNVRHVVGLVSVSITPPAGDATDTMPSAFSVTSVGMHVYSGSPSGSGIVLGYAKETTLLMPNNACVDLQAASLCAAAAKTNSNSAEGGTR